MTSHLGLLVTFAGLVSAVFAALHRDTPRDQLRLAAKLFVVFLGGALALGWVQFLVFG